MGELYQPKALDAFGVGIYYLVPSSMQIDVVNEFIEIVVYKDDSRQKILTRHFIHPLVLEF
jgi:hypothetical protein